MVLIDLNTCIFFFSLSGQLNLIWKNISLDSDIDVNDIMVDFTHYENVSLPFI